MNCTNCNNIYKMLTKEHLFDELKKTVKVEIYKKDFDLLINKIIKLDRYEFVKQLKEEIDYDTTASEFLEIIDKIVERKFI